MENPAQIRKIIHIDMDAFFASVEQRDNPDLKGKPIAVGGNAVRGVVAAASYEARKYGVKSAMPSVTAARNCPDLIFVKPRFERYKEVSAQIRSIFYEYTDLVEPLSLDEAYLDVTTNKIGLNSATIIAQEIKQKIYDQTKLTASAGISYCKFLAKTASDVNKPNGIFTILPQDAEAYLRKMPISQFHGIGKATAEKMKYAGIFKGSDLLLKSKEDLIRRYGKAGAYYYNICRGIDNRPVNPSRDTKTISAERTFTHNLMKLTEVIKEIERISSITFDRYSQKQLKGKTVTLKIKYGDFRQITRNHTVEQCILTEKQLQDAALTLADETLLHEEGIRLIGIGISNLHKEGPENRPGQLTFEF